MRDPDTRWIWLNKPGTDASRSQHSRNESIAATNVNESTAHTMAIQ